MTFKVSCKVCDKEITVTPSRYKAREFFYCSTTCEVLDKKGELNHTCPVCGKQIHLKPSRLKRSKNVCCSLMCSSKLKETIFCNDQNHQFGKKGELNSSYKVDIRLNPYGYILIRSLHHPFSQYNGFVFLHRLVMEHYLRDTQPDSPYLIEVDGFSDRYLNPDLVVHHVDGNKLNNVISNLQVTATSEHTAMHNQMDKQDYVRDCAGRFVRQEKKKLKSNINQLTKKHFLDAGLDICSSEDCVIKAHTSRLITTGLYIEIPAYYVGLIWSRSGLSVKHNIEVGAGCIDASYRGEVKVHLYNHGNNDYIIKAGDRIAQLLTVPISLGQYKDVEQLTATDRGAGGFGHTGN